jgi:anti-sigma regulatory factor (Ser/Thr protein kinase)
MNAILLDSLPTVRLELQSRPECVTLVRSMLAGLGEFLELEPELLDDLRTAISEAANNVVLHAYEGEPGPLIVSLEITRDGFEVVVRDRGGGIKRVAAAEDRMGVGLAVISALADRAEFESHPDGGTAVRMSFTRNDLKLAVPEDWTRGLVLAPPEVDGDIVATIAPVDLLGEVLGRLTRAVAAGAHFSLDRFSDLYPVTDAIAAQARQSPAESSISFGIVGRPRRIELTVGPFTAGALDALTSNGGSPLQRLVDELDVVPTGSHELLSVTIVDKRPPAG